ncbi:MAG: hypothetical protein HC790_08250 [Acaryochloridaceae cyanobacterium CSU_3_4]|nr:hypothetical protein [Acaryochloridaceae cyanobacterium CSU_3_4]
MQRDPVPQPLVALTAPYAVIQRVKYATPKALKEAMNAEQFDDLSNSEKDSISNEFPSWFSKAYKKSYRTHDFPTVNDLNETIRQMINAVDTFTDEEGQALTDKINSTTEKLLPIGYHAGGKDKPQQQGVKPFGSGKIGSQIGDGYYIAKDLSVAKEYANQYIIQGMIANIQKVYINIEKIKETLLIKGVSVKEWWKGYDTENDNTFDMIVAGISGQVGGGSSQVQYKTNPKHKETGLLFLEQIIETDEYERIESLQG